MLLFEVPAKNKIMIPTWVLDTNVLVAALLSPNGPPGRLLDAVLQGSLQLALDDRIEAEYRAVLLRKKFGFEPQIIHALLVGFAFQKKISAPPLCGLHLPDRDDLLFLEVASQLEDPVLVTGNAKHFPSSLTGKVKIFSPREAWERLSKIVE